LTGNVFTAYRSRKHTGHRWWLVDEAASINFTKREFFDRVSFSRGRKLAAEISRRTFHGGISGGERCATPMVTRSKCHGESFFCRGEFFTRDETCDTFGGGRYSRGRGDILYRFYRASTHKVTRDIDIAILSVRPSVRPPVRPSVCLSVTFWYSVETA